MKFKSLLALVLALLMLCSCVSCGDSNRIVLDGADDPALAKGANLRIMSYNILAELWDTLAGETLPGREQLVSDVIHSYLPDVIGLQEATSKWHRLLNPLIEGEYAWAGETLNDTTITNYSAILYNVKTVELIECKSIIYTACDAPEMRNLTLARFKHKKSKKEFIVTSTHWGIYEEDRIENQPENVKFINELLDTYNLPIFATGDYNSNEEALFKPFLEGTGMVDPKFNAEIINRATKTTHKLTQPLADDTGLAIDHIAVTKGVRILYYNVLICHTTINASDHFPVYIDVKI